MSLGLYGLEVELIPEFKADAGLQPVKAGGGRGDGDGGEDGGGGGGGEAKGGKKGGGGDGGGGGGGGGGSGVKTADLAMDIKKADGKSVKLSASVSG